MNSYCNDPGYFSALEHNNKEKHKNVSINSLLVSRPDKRLYIIAGPPGSGKSTFAKQLALQQNINFILEADMWMIDNKGDYCFNPQKLRFCHMQCQDKAKAVMSVNQPLIISNTSLTRREALPYIKLAIEFNYKVEIHHMDGIYKNIHDVPEEKVQKMRIKHEKYKIQDFDINI